MDMSKEVSHFDLQKFYPNELEILSISETPEEITIFMKSHSVSYGSSSKCNTNSRSFSFTSEFIRSRT